MWTYVDKMYALNEGYMFLGGFWLNSYSNLTMWTKMCTLTEADLFYAGFD